MRNRLRQVLLYNDEPALLRSNYHTKLIYSAEKPESSTQNTNQKRRTNVIWFNPPCSKNTRTNVAHKFLALIDKHVPKHPYFTRFLTGTLSRLAATPVCPMRKVHLQPQPPRIK